MRKIMIASLCLGIIATLSGCGKIKGPRFWWDDRNQEKVVEGYQLPDEYGAPADHGIEHAAAASGSDLSDNDLRDYRTNLDQAEEKRKSESSLVDF